MKLARVQRTEARLADAAGDDACAALRCIRSSARRLVRVQRRPATTQGTSTGSENVGGGSTGVTNPSGGGGEGGGLFTTGTGNPNSPLKVSPELPTLKLELPLVAPAPTMQFSCLDISTNQPYPGASWVLDSPALGTIDATGLFTANGTAAGDVKVTCKSGAGRPSRPSRSPLICWRTPATCLPIRLPCSRAPGARPTPAGRCSIPTT